MSRTAAGAALVALCATLPLAAQQEPAVQRETPVQQRPHWTSRVAVRPLGGDVDEFVVTGGARFVDARLGLDLRADRVVVVLDRPEAVRIARRDDDDSASGLPRRAPSLPRARRGLDAGVLRERLLSFLGSLRGPETPPPPAGLDLELFRSIHLEGDVAILRGGFEVLRAEALTWSLLDDRMVLDDVTLRLRDSATPAVVTLRAPRLVRQDGRFVGSDVSVTTSRAGEPHFEIASGEIEIIERGDQFEIRSRGNVLAVGGRSLLPIPDQTWFTAERPSYLVRGIGAGTSNRQGFELRLDIGSSWNETGGRLHEALTGRARETFRGDWELGTEWIEKRGITLRPRVEYAADGQYDGYTKGFFLDDAGEDIGLIRRQLDGTLIDADNRRLIRSENRVSLGEHTTLDLTLFEASDPAVLAEFERGDYFELERPETSLHLRDARANRIATATGRWNLNDFAYGDDRGLMERFVEEQPRLTYDVFSTSLARLPGDTHLLLTSSTELAQLRSRQDPLSARPRPDDETWRADQEFELAVPFDLGPLGVRPFASGRATWYERARDGDAAGRSALAAGVEVGSRLARTWSWLDDAGSRHQLRHVLSPTVRFAHTYAVDRDPADLPQFDAVDALDEQSNIRVGLLQRLLRRVEPAGDEAETNEFLWLDLAQNFAPNSERDNDGERLGLGEFEAILRPLPADWDAVPIELVVEGEQDWNAHELRTFNNFLRMKAGDVTWLAEYREDRTQSGQFGFGTVVPVRERWEVFGRGLYDIEQSDFTNYTTRLTRNDLDWRVAFVINYNVIGDNMTFRIDFEPTLGGLARRGPRYRVGGADFAANDHSAF